MSTNNSTQTRYEIHSSGNGSTVSLTRRDDGATLFLQGDDAADFMASLACTTDAYTDDDLCSEYDDVFGT